MQRLKRIALLVFIFFYNVSSLGNYLQYAFQPVYAQSASSKVDLVAIFVDNQIYGSIQGDLQRYTDSYIPKQSPGTKSLVFPIDVDGFQAKDIQQILENLYFDGEKNVPSRLAGVILFGNIPLPIVELEQRRFETIYPYVDFVDPMFMYDPANDIFMYNEFPDSLPEVWHSIIPSVDTGLFSKFFAKIKQYDANPKKYAKKRIWLEDFPFMKDSYTEEELDHYINRMLFSEAESYRRVNSLFSKVLKREFEEDLIESTQVTEEAVDERIAEIATDKVLADDPEVHAIGKELGQKSKTIVDRIGSDKIEAQLQDSADKPLPTLLLEKTLEEEFDDNQVIFGDYYLSHLQENVLAGGRYQLEDIDFSLEKIAFRDRVTRQYLEDINTMLENEIDDRIYNNDYFLKYPIPYEYNIWDKGSNYCITYPEAIAGVGDNYRFENMYKGRNAVDVLEYPELSITRGSYYNEVDVDNLRQTPLVVRGEENLEDRPGFDPSTISVGAGYGWHSQQVRQNRSFDFEESLPDKDIYDERKCNENQSLEDFSYQFWGGGSSLNIDPDRTAVNFKTPLTRKPTTNEEYAWHPSIDRRIGSPLYDVGGGTYHTERIDVDRLDRYAHHDNGSLLLVNPCDLQPATFPHDSSCNMCTSRRQLDERGGFTSYEEVEFFDANGEWFDGFGVFLNKEKELLSSERLTIVVHSPTGKVRDKDSDWILNYADSDDDNDSIPDVVDPDQDNDQLLNGDDYDIADHGPMFFNGNSDRLHMDMDQDGVPNYLDADMNNDGEPNGSDTNIDGDWYLDYDKWLENAPSQKDPDIDADTLVNWRDANIDSDKWYNREDPDVDADGKLNKDDEDIDADNRYNGEDKSCSGCGGGCGCGGRQGYGEDEAEESSSGDDDTDGDGIPNKEDPDQDGDGVSNSEDSDVDDDGLLNANDGDDDNDSIKDGDDEDPQGYGTWSVVPGSWIDGFARLFAPEIAHAGEDCHARPSPSDIDDDGFSNRNDPDMDGDGVPNGEDNDVDGDGLLNTEDEDIDCDGVINDDDDDIDGDGKPNIGDEDTDGDGIYNGYDLDIDGDGVPNDIDDDLDADGDTNDSDIDVDNDGLLNALDPDIDADGILNQNDPYPYGAGGKTTPTPTIAGDSLLDDADVSLAENNHALAAGIVNRKEVKHIEPTWLPSPCFTTWYDYRYQLINTVTKHKGPVNEELDAMNTLTQERPIDDSRYVSFMGIGGDLVKFIYPDMYRVDVFAGTDLLSKEEIEKRITQYLIDKVQLYNQYLEIQLTKAPGYYALHPIEYDVLATVDPAASPARTYDLIPETTLIDIVGERNIKRIAESLYHLNVTWKDARPTAVTVGGYIEEARENFDLNDKIEFVIDEYLQYDDPGNDFLFDEIAYPLHIEKGYAYEVGVISSDGSDRSGDQILLDGSDEDVPTEVENFTKVDIGNTDYAAYGDVVNDLAEDDSACNIPPSGSVPILRRPKDVACWREKTLEKPVDFEFSIEVDFAPLETSNELSERRERVDGAVEQVKRSGFISPRPQLGVAGSAYVSSFLDHGSLGPFVPYVFSASESRETYTLGDSEAGRITATKENDLRDILFNDAEQDIFDMLRYDVGLSLSAGVQSVLSDDTIDLTIQSLENAGSVTINFTSIGESCPLIDGKDICSGGLSLTMNPYTDPQILPVSFGDTVAGDVVIIADVCQGAICAQHDMLLHRTPTDVARMSIQTVSDTIVAGGRIPLRVQAWDVYDNKVNISITPYQISLSAGTFEDGSQQQRIDTFTHAAYVIDATGIPPGASIDAVISVVDDEDAIEYPVSTYSFDVVQGSLQASETTIDYRLPSQDIGFHTTNDVGIRELLIENIPGIDLEVIGGEQGLAVPVEIRSTRGLLQVGRAIQNDENSVLRFVPGDRYIFEDGKGSLVFLPTGVAGDERIVISSPGMEDEYVDITIRPSGAEKITMDMDTYGVHNGDKIAGEVHIFDSWGNVYYEETQVDLTSLGGRELDEEYKSFTCRGGSATIGGVVTGGGSCGARCKASATNGWNSSAFTTAEFSVDDVLWPNNPNQDDINVMYLNLFGGPWGNHADTINHLKNTKTISITTQFDRMGDVTAQPKIMMMMSPEGSIKNPGLLHSELVAELGNIYALLGNQGSIGRISFGNWQHFSYNEQGKPSYSQGNPAGIITYTPLAADSAFTMNGMEEGKIILNGDIVVDFIRGSMDPDIFIRLPEGGGNVWDVTYNNKLIGALSVRRGGDAFPELQLANEAYGTEAMPFGSSSNSDQGIAIYIQNDATTPGTVTLFESIEATADSRTHAGFRHDFANITNFAQGLPVGQATKHFGNPFVINYGDPFLTRIKDNREVLATDYDDGIGQVVFSDTEKFLDADVIDIDKDGKQDMVISYQDGSIRLLKNYGGEEPFLDMGSLLVVGDGLKEVFAGDIDGDGWEDLLVLTSADKMRAYRNIQGQFEVDGQLVCLDIPLGHRNISQTRQLFVEDMDSDGVLDIITNDINGDIKVFYGGGNNYLSTDPFVCDDDWKKRQAPHVELVKSFSTQLGGPIKDGSLRYRPGLQESVPDPAAQQFVDANTSGADANFRKMTKPQIEAFIQAQMKTVIDPVRNVDPWELAAEGVEKLDYAIPVPDALKPEKYYDDDTIAATRAIDPNQDVPRFDVSKKFTDLDGGSLLKGDIVRVDVSLIPVGGSVGPVMYWEKLSGPWIIYKDEYNKIDPFDEGSIPDEAIIDRNISQGYEFMMYDLQLNGTVNFSYEIQYDGNGYVNIDVETIQSGLYRGPTKGSIASILGSTVYAQSRAWTKKLRVFADDGCYKKYREFTPGESVVDLASRQQQKQTEYLDHFDDAREDTFDMIEQNFKLESIKDMMGILESLERRHFDDREGEILRSKSPGYLDYFAKQFEQRIDVYTDDPDLGYPVEKLGVFEDYEFNYQKCGDTSFGKQMCGQGIPMPFNMAFLSPGTYNIMGCKPGPESLNIPGIFPDDKGIPLFAFPTKLPFYFWPGSPPIPTNGIGGYFGGNTSMFRMYVSPTLTNGVGLALCFGQYDKGMKIPSPVGDTVGNCMVIASSPLIGSECTQGLPIKKVHNDKQQQSDYILYPQQYDLYETTTCNQKGQAMSPLVSPQLGGKVDVQGRPRAIQATTSNVRQRDRSKSGDVGNVDEWDIKVGGSNLLSLEKENLKGGTAYDLKVEGGDVKGLVQCIVRNRGEKQMRYFANNALSMQMQVILPDFSELGKNLHTLKEASNRRILRKADATDPDKANQELADQGPKNTHIEHEQTSPERQTPQAYLDNLAENSLNPFKSLTALFDDIPLVNIEYQTVSLEIPWILNEDLSRYNAYLTAWIERNEQVVDAWKQQYKDSTKRKDEEGKIDREKAGDATIIPELEKTLNAVKRNHQTLKLYKDLPDKLRAWARAADQYIYEITSFIETFVHQVTAWLQDNARRFSQWVDTIILLRGIVETRQVLIDFSVNRHAKCAECRQDYYDFYSCKLSLLCVDLPILPIPNFHLPNIFIDLSNINVGIDFILPDIRFVPKKVPLIDLPDLPYPQQIDIDITIPQVPALPPPPPLPELPELDLDVTIRLPTLPPAPKIPPISPAIKVVLDVADYIGGLFCIFKSNVGQVAEQGVKTRIEQMTQRKEDLIPFDGLKITLPDSPVAGFDYKVESFVDIKADFSVLYNAVDQVALQRNEWMTKSSQAVDVTIKKGTEWGAQYLEYGDIDGDIDINLGLEASQERWEPDALAQERLDERLSSHIGGSYETVRYSLTAGLEYLLSRTDMSHYHNATRSILATVTMDTEVAPNYTGIERMKEQLLEDLSLHQQKYQTIAEELEDYDRFIAGLSDRSLISETGYTRSYEAALFTANTDMVHMLKNQEHPTMSAINMQRDIVSGYHGALKRSNHYDLGMNALQHEDLTTYFADLETTLDAIPHDLPLGEKQPLLAAATSIDTELGSVSVVEQRADVQATATTQNVSSVPDFTQFIEGFFVPGKDGYYHNVIAWNEKGNDRYHENTYHIDDINSDGKQDIFLYDRHQVFVKYAKQNDTYGGGGYGQQVIGPFSSMEQLIAEVEPDDGRYQDRFKLRDYEPVSYDFIRQGQNYDAMTREWEHDPRVAGYVIELTEGVTTNHEKNRGSSAVNDPQRTQYIVVLPESMTYEGLSIEIPKQLQKGSVQEYLDDGTVLAVKSYNAKQPTVQLLLRDLPRKRYYSKLSPLYIEEDASGGSTNSWLGTLFGNRASSTPGYYLKKKGPWSAQHLAGAQYASDDIAPTVAVELIRDITGETQGEGRHLQGYINTSYTMEATRKDNGKVVENWIVYSGDVVAIEKGEKIKMEELIYKYPVEEEFIFIALDQAGNIAKELVKLNIAVPELDVDYIEYKGGGADVWTELSQTIDEGVVKFERNRLGFWEPLDPDTFPVKPTDPQVIGGLYPFDKQIYLYNSAGGKTCSVNSETGEIIPHQDGVKVEVDFTDGWAKVVVGSSEGAVNNNLFAVHLQGASMDEGGIVIQNNSYEALPMITNFVGGFDQGTCIRPRGDECHIFVSVHGDVYIPEPYNDEYSGIYAYDDGEVLYTIQGTQGSVGTIRFTPQPFN